MTNLFRSPVLLVAVLAIGLAACSGTPTDAPIDAPSLAEATADSEDTLRRCPTYKIAFTRATGCQNDGSIELCVPQADVRLQARIRRTFPGVTYVGSGGRARCNTTTELLAMIPTSEPTECRGDVMTRATWDSVCTVASEPKVRKIVATFFE